MHNGSMSDDLFPPLNNESVPVPPLLDFLHDGLNVRLQVANILAQSNVSQFPYMGRGIVRTSDSFVHSSLGRGAWRTLAWEARLKRKARS